MTKSGTGTWDLGARTRALRDVGRGDVGTWDSGTPGRGTWDVGRGTWDVGRGTWDVGRADAGTRGRRNAKNFALNLQFTFTPYLLLEAAWPSG